MKQATMKRDNYEFRVKLLKILCSKTKYTMSCKEGKIALKSPTKTMQVPSQIWNDLINNQFISKHNESYRVTSDGKRYLKRLMCQVDEFDGDQFQSQHQDLKPATELGFNAMIRAKVNLNESPLMRIKQLRTKTGEAFLSNSEFQAGERLRKEFELSQMTPQITMNWDRLGNGGGSKNYGAGGKAELGDNAIAARQRLNKTFAVVGPELSGVLQDICCYLKGLGEVERERVWPQRSAKLILKIALGVLARYYGFEVEYMPNKGNPTMRHWGVEDYRPKVIPR
jgi:predicted transcriptional regulator